MSEYSSIMAKFALIFVSALFALQGSNTSPLTIQPYLEVGNGVNDLINEINKVLSDASEREFALQKQLYDKLSEIETAADIPSLVTDLRQNITQTLADGGKAGYVCHQNAWKNFDELTKLTSVEHCRFQIDDEATDLKERVQRLILQVKYLLKATGTSIKSCVMQYPDDYDKYEECVEESVVCNKERLKVDENAIHDIFNLLENFVPIYTNMMGECVNDKKQELINKMIALIEDVQLCIKGNSKDHTFNFTSIVYVYTHVNFA